MRWQLHIRRLWQTLFAKHQPERPLSPAELGIWGEKAAANWLKQQGWRIVGRQVRPNRHDEIDIIAMKGNVTAFVEVKTRATPGYLRPAASVNRAKRLALSRAARAFARRADNRRMIYRCDIIEVIGRPGATPPEINHIESAFRFTT